MKYFIRFLFIGGLAISCNKPHRNQENNNKIGIDTTAIIKKLITQTAIEAFTQDEKSALDSLSKYQLNSIHDSCIKYLYVIYCNESISDTNMNVRQTIGQTNLKIIAFKSKSNIIKKLFYGVFINDSIPTNIIINTSSGHMINSFDVNLKTKKLLNATTGGTGVMTIKNVQALFDSALRSDVFKTYVANNNKILHPKFSNFLSR
jgi:hypothetical protein